MAINLTPEEYVILRAEYKSSKDRKHSERINIILLLHKGYSQREISDILNLDEDTVSKWKIAFVERKDTKSWLSTNYAGYFGKLSTCSISDLRKYITTFKVSNKAEIQSYLLQTLKAKFSLSGLQKLLTRTGFSYQTIHKLPGKCPIEKQEKWIINFKKLLENKTPEQVFLFMDGVHPTHNTKYSKLWSEKGKPRFIESNTGRERLNICGAYNPDNQDITYINSETINGKTIIELLKKIALKYTPNQLVTIFLDNATYHKSQEVKDFLATIPHVKFEFLPPYSPNLNLIERLWKFANEKVINLKYYPKYDEFKSKILAFYDNLKKYQNELASRITYNFQTFNNSCL